MNTRSVRVLFDKILSPGRLEDVRLRLAEYGLDQGGTEDNLSDPDIHLLIQESGLSLVYPDLDERARVQIDFTSGAANHRRLFGGGKSQALVRAMGLDHKKGLQVVDATAGLAGDSFVLASLGANVLMLERCPALTIMIEEALNRASGEADSGTPDLQPIIARMQLIHTNSLDWLAAREEDSYEVVYLDPMFPERKKKAAVKKEMQLLQALLEPSLMDDALREAEERELLAQARRVSKFRTVVKRPRQAPPLADEKPGYSLEGKSTRFDIYPKRAIN